MNMLDIKKMVKDNCSQGGFITVENNIISVKEHCLDNKGIKTLCDNLNKSISGISIITNSNEIKVLITQPRKRGI